MSARLLSDRKWIGRSGSEESTTIWYEFKENGDLAISAQDIGSSVEQAWGSDDFEYGLSIPASALPLLVPELLAHALSDEPPLTLGRLRAICEKLCIDPGAWSWP